MCFTFHVFYALGMSRYQYRYRYRAFPEYLYSGKPSRCFTRYLSGQAGELQIFSPPWSVLSPPCCLRPLSLLLSHLPRPSVQFSPPVPPSMQCSILRPVLSPPLPRAVRAVLSSPSPVHAVLFPPSRSLSSPSPGRPCHSLLPFPRPSVRPVLSSTPLPVHAVPVLFSPVRPCRSPPSICQGGERR